MIYPMGPLHGDVLGATPSIQLHRGNVNGVQYCEIEIVDGLVVGGGIFYVCLVYNKTVINMFLNWIWDEM